jgi:hypothetical protein
LVTSPNGGLAVLYLIFEEAYVKIVVVGNLLRFEGPGKRCGGLRGVRKGLQGDDARL